MRVDLLHDVPGILTGAREPLSSRVGVDSPPTGGHPGCSAYISRSTGWALTSHGAGSSGDGVVCVAQRRLVGGQAFQSWGLL
jgi:hypothetical protein